jgi:hypothetical protein
MATGDQGADRKLLDALHRNRDAVRCACCAVVRVASALHRVGLRDLAEELDDAVSGLEQTSNDALAAWNDSMTAQMAHGEAMLGGMLMLGLKLAGGRQ